MVEPTKNSSSDTIAKSKDIIIFYVNGQRHTLSTNDTRAYTQPESSLIEYLRGQGLVGTKLGCGEGGCGACTVLIQDWDAELKRIRNKSVNACLFPLYACHGCHIITVEGIGSYRESNMHPVQRALMKNHGSQCGFCTPGIIMSLYALLRQNPTPTQKEIEECLDGNLCRCTGYRPILEGARKWFALEDSFKNSSQKSTNTDSDSTRICPSSGKPCKCGVQSDPTPDSDEKSFCTNVHGPAQPIFPVELRDFKYDSPIHIKGTRVEWLAPLSLQELISKRAECIRQNQQCRIVVGNTEIGIEMNILCREYPSILYPRYISEMNEYKVLDNGVFVGANTSLSYMMNNFKKLIADATPDNEHLYRPLKAAVRQLKWFASTPIRNVASIAGNICNASPISDLNPVWAAIGAHIVVQNEKGERREIPVNKLFVGYRKTSMEPDEVMIALFIPFTAKNQYCQAFKQARRREDDIAIVTSCMFAEMKSDSNVVENCGFSFGGMWIHTKSAKKTEEFLKGKEWNDNTFYEAIEHLKSDMQLQQDAPPGMIEYRMALTFSFFYKFFLEVKASLSGEPLDPSIESAITEFERPPSHGKQFFTVNQRGTSVGLPKRHRTSHVQVTGEAAYVDDIPAQFKELHAFPVMSNVAKAALVSVDASEALKLPGVVDFVSVNDVKGENVWCPGSVADEELFISKNVTSQGQIIGLIVAESHRDAKLAAKKVKVVYETEDDPIFSIKEAIEKESFLAEPHKIEMGNVDKAFENPSEDFDIVEGDMQVGGQEHFYLEPNAVLAVPMENHEMLVYSSTQALSKTQHVVADILGVPMHKVVSKIKRIGGGFGGKESRTVMFAATCAVAAKKLNRPVRMIIDRQMDVESTGQRHPFYGKYKVLVSKTTGAIEALDVQLYSNAGYSVDLSLAVMDRAIFHIDNCYRVPNLRVIGWACKTNLPSNTAFRGFGGPQGMMITENIIDHISSKIQIPAHTLREKNLYQEGDQTHFGQVLSHCRLPRLWEDCMKISNFQDRLAKVEEFNKKNKYKKRGISIVPTKFGISFTAFFLNQGSALVHIYTDGTVLVSSGGVEMGQGLNTKVIQVAATTLDVDISRVFIAETSTDKIPNMSATAASVGSDLYGMAVLDACQQLSKRLAPVRKKLGKDATFEQVCQEAYLERINLSAQGFYKTPGLNMDWETGRGSPFRYFTFGAACSEVEIDCLTGDHQVIRTDIVMDVGESLNPAVDIGQIEGAFVQGYGLFVLEEMIRGDKDHKWIRSQGATMTNGPGFYKIPSFNDIPIEFNIHLLPNAPNELAVHKSKAIGEPPLFLSSSIFYAIKEAIRSYRQQNEIGGEFVLDSPASAERIRMSCTDSITRRVFDNENDMVSFRAKGSF